MRPGPDEIAAALAPHLPSAVPEGHRHLLGLAGPPGVGKSTVAHALARIWAGAHGSATVAVVGMDGFHLRQRDLAARGLESVKGAPQTFDAEGFVAAVRGLTDASTTARLPAFDRDREEPVDDAVTVEPGRRLVLVEGNYLLLDGPWAAVREVLDEVWYLHLPDEVRVPDLVARHVAHGRTPQAARAWVERSDEANARLVAATAGRADLVVDLSSLEVTREA